MAIEPGWEAFTMAFLNAGGSSPSEVYLGILDSISFAPSEADLGVGDYDDLGEFDDFSFSATEIDYPLYQRVPIDPANWVFSTPTINSARAVWTAPEPEERIVLPAVDTSTDMSSKFWAIFDGPDRDEGHLVAHGEISGTVPAGERPLFDGMRIDYLTAGDPQTIPVHGQSITFDADVLVEFFKHLLGVDSVSASPSFAAMHRLDAGSTVYDPAEILIATQVGEIAWDEDTSRAYNVDAISVPFSDYAPALVGDTYDWTASCLIAEKRAGNCGMHQIGLTTFSPRSMWSGGVTIAAENMTWSLFGYWGTQSP